MSLFNYLSTNDIMQIALYIQENDPDINGYNKEGLTPLIFCLKHNIDIKIIEFLIQLRADINLCDLDGWRPLIYAIGSGKEILVKLFLDYNANLYLLNNQLTYISYAYRSGKFKIAGMLIDYGADINQVNDNGRDNKYYLRRQLKDIINLDDELYKLIYNSNDPSPNLAKLRSVIE